MVNMWLAEELYYRGINNYIQAYMGDTLVWEKFNNDYFYVKALAGGLTNISINLKGYYLDGYEELNWHNRKKHFITQEEAPYLEYSTDKKNWTVWQIEEHPDDTYKQRYKPVQLRYNQTLYIRGANLNYSLSTIFEEDDAVVVSQLYADNDISVGGDIFTLLNYQQSKNSSNRRIGDYGLAEFLSTLNLIYADKLYIDNIKEVGYCGLFMFHSVIYYYHSADSKLKSSANIVIDEDTILNEYSLTYLLYGSIVCEKHNVVLNATTLAPYCYQSLFYANRLMTIAPELPATELTEGCYYEMFRGCYALEETPDLRAKVIPKSAYYYMFGSTPLKKCTIYAEEIIGDAACAYIFSGCSGFTETPTFPNLRYIEGKSAFLSAFTRLPFSRIDLNEMFPSLTTEGVANSVSLFGSCLVGNKYVEEFIALNITKEPERIYSYTLQNCENLKRIELFAEELSDGCYYGMCYAPYITTSLTEAPILRAKYVPSLAYTSMFYGCEKLDEVISFAESWAGGSGNDRGAYNWLYDVAPEGTLYVPAGMIDKYPRGNNGNMHLPTGWNIQSVDTITDYLKFENFASIRYTTNGEITPNFEYSTDGVNFKKWDYHGLGGSTIYLRGVNNQRISDMNNHFVIIDDYDGYSYLSGNIMSLVDGYGWTNKIPQEGMFEGLFLACDLGNITGLKLPATELAPYCYANMFDNTTLNYNSFELPATKLAEGCYKEMFANSDVRNAYTDYDYNDNPHIEGILTELPATELAPYCYAGMYKNCKRLQCTPNLPATKLEEGCYYEMFRGCDNQYFIEINTLPATELAPYCYAGMYKNSSQNRTYDINTDIIPTYACANMYEGCELDYTPYITANKIEDYGCAEMFVRTSNFTSAKIPDIIELAPYCYAGMYQQSSAIVVEGSVGTNLAPYCCEYMFAGSEITQIYLPATKLEEGCYRDMFADCYNLNLIRCYAEELAKDSTMGWVKGVCSEGKFYTKNLSIWEGLGNNDGIPYCWSVEIFD